MKKLKKLIPNKLMGKCQTELEYIEKQGLEDYFLTIKSSGKKVENSCGSWVAYAIGITKQKPKDKLRLIPDYTSLPDIDCDFPDRDLIADYIIGKYGADKSCHIGGYTQMKLRGVMKMLSIVDRIPFNQINPVTKSLHEDDSPYTACIREPVFADWYEIPENKKWLHKYVMPMVGMIGSTTRHPAGMVIAPKKICKYLPLKMQDFKVESEKTDERKRVVLTQWKDKDVEDRGLLKVDNLGLRTLTILTLIRDYIKDKIVFTAIPFDDKKVFKSFRRLNTNHIFQFDTDHGKKIISNLRPYNIEDIIAGTAISRPGTTIGGYDIIFCQRRHGEKEVEYPHPLLEPVLKSTFGIFVFQEQIMQAVHVLGGLTLIESDKFRKAIKAKDPKVMKKFNKKFVEGAVQRGCKDKAEANGIFETILSFGKYGFNRSHACAYALYSYWLMWFKIYYPHEFFIANFMNPKDKDSIPNIWLDCKRNKVKVKLPHVNLSKDNFALRTNKKNIKYIVWGFNGIKGLGAKTVEPLLESQPYKDMKDLSERGGKAFSKTVVEALIFSGGLDKWGDRHELLLEFADLRYPDLKRGGKSKTYKTIVEGGLKVKGYKDYAPLDFYRKQIDVLGFCPISVKEYFADKLSKYKPMSSEEYGSCGDGDMVMIAGVLTRTFGRSYKGNKRMMFADVEDGIEKYTVILWDDYLSQEYTEDGEKYTFEEMVEMLKGNLVVVCGVNKEDYKSPDKYVIHISTRSRAKIRGYKETGAFIKGVKA